MSRRTWFVLGAAVFAGAGFLPMLVGAALGLEWVAVTGALLSYFGISIFPPGVFAGLAAADWSRARGGRRPSLLGVGVGISVTLGLIIAFASLVEALGIAEY